MAYILPDAQKMLVSSFLEIAVGQTTNTAQQFLQATNWNLEGAIQLFYNGNNEVAAPTPAASLNSWDDDDVRPPLPVRREVLYGDYSRNFDEETWNNSPVHEETDEISSSTLDTRHNSLASMYRPPYELMYNGPFQNAKDAAIAKNKWLLVNLQSMQEFTSATLNRDTWSNDVVAEAIKSNFVFWQVDDDTEEGKKVCTYYKFETMPVILVIDPITGEKMRYWNGMVEPENLLEDVMFFLDQSPSEYHANLIHKQRGKGKIPGDRIRERDELQEINEIPDDFNKRCGKIPRDKIKEGNEVQEINEITDDSEVDQKQLLNKKIVYLPLPEEPKCDRNFLCRIAIHLPNGRRIQRNFLKTDSIKLLWSFCSTQFEEAETRPFRFTQAMPGASKFLEYDSNLTFEKSGLDNSIVSVIIM
ncbi:plant UBX domain-containing protein 7-like [Lycium barbarum]|uniref:plant UBX domain-containing protein 7-like n=1 Tax=Lycium barbarum TaxID=112863 RepID=UPI00293E1F00|nr:plant UBX domain-containing protein 7-like [Lycium barbarum]